MLKDYYYNRPAMTRSCFFTSKRLHSNFFIVITYTCMYTLPLQLSSTVRNVYSDAFKTGPLISIKEICLVLQELKLNELI